ncbi:MAG TPA: hypothetical protein PLU23_03925, partial [Anaerolineaceae bacterium]|nr:hypothetical protein [Anaerolineaceae bacterium]
MRKNTLLIAIVLIAALVLGACSSPPKPPLLNPLAHYASGQTNNARQSLTTWLPNSKKPTTL